MELDDSLLIIKEVLNNRTENRAYDYYLSTLIFSLFSKEKPQTYSEFKCKLLNPKKDKVRRKMTEEEKKSIKDKNNNILKNIKVGD